MKTQKFIQLHLTNYSYSRVAKHNKQYFPPNCKLIWQYSIAVWMEHVTFCALQNWLVYVLYIWRLMSVRMGNFPHKGIVRTRWPFRLPKLSCLHKCAAMVAVCPFHVNDSFPHMVTNAHRHTHTHILTLLSPIIVIQDGHDSDSVHTHIKLTHSRKHTHCQDRSLEVTSLTASVVL